jgi:hypothetical protein
MLVNGQRRKVDIDGEIAISNNREKESLCLGSYIK